MNKLDRAAIDALKFQIALGERNGENVSLLKRALEFGMGKPSQAAPEARSEALSEALDDVAQCWLALIGEPA